MMSDTLSGSAFVIYWQHTGAVQYLIEYVLFPMPERAEQYNWMHKMRRRTVSKWIIMIIFVTVIVIIQTIADIVRHAIKFGYSIYEMFHIHPMNGCVPIENKEKILEERLLDAFLTHKALGRKIRDADKIFQIYVLFMVATGIPISIFALISVVRIPRDWSQWLYAAKDVCCCIVHLLGFTLIPARLYAEYNAVQRYIVCSSAHLAKVADQKLNSIVLSFIPTQVKIGISLGGLIVITKPFIFQCVSILIPYLILSLQNNLGKE
ncbi:hypothetical protein Ddc_03785 [Ditylenchus destructor]|nr:hypothetical protein Ddc_03785 [Ditylenchus destructor]